MKPNDSLNKRINTIESKILVMADMQKNLNDVVDTDWILKKYDWQRCIMIELCELIDHYGYKHWKKQEEDLEQCKLEVLDIFHFWISHVFTFGTREDFKSFILLLANSKNIKTRPSRQYTLLKLDELVGKASEKKFSHNDMHILVGMFMDFNTLYRYYILKNTLNLFRQSNGYKDGSYKKIWNGKEDNEVLIELAVKCKYDQLKIKEEMLKIYKDLD